MNERRNRNQKIPRTINSIREISRRNDFQIQEKSNKKDHEERRNLQEGSTIFKQENKRYRKEIKNPNTKQGGPRDKQVRGRNSRQVSGRVRNVSNRPGTNLVQRQRNNIDNRSISVRRGSTVSNSFGGSRDIVHSDYITKGGFPSLLKTPHRSYAEDGNSIRISGSELLYTVVINTTLSTSPAPTAPGDVVMLIPLSPTFVVGSQLWLEAKNWYKYKIRGVRFHYVPNSGGLQTGSWIMAMDRDPSDVNNIFTNTLARERKFAGMEGSTLFSVSDYGSIAYHPLKTTPKWFEVNPNDEDAEISMPGLFILAAGSSFTPIGTEILFTTGNIYVEYDYEFSDRTNQIVNPSIPSDVYFNYSQTNTFTWTTVAIDTNISFTQAALVAAGISLTRMYQITILIITKSCSSGGLDLFVTDYHQSAWKFLSQGQVYYLRPADDNGASFVYASIEDALMQRANTTLQWSTAAVGASTLTFSAYANTIDLRF